MSYDINAISVAVSGAATVVIAIFTCLLFVATLKLWNANKQQIKALIDSDRPWVGPWSVTFTAPLTPDNLKQSQVVILNTGNTPALNMRVAVKGERLRSGALPRKPDTTQEPAKALFPNTPDFYRPFEHTTMSAQDIASVLAGEYCLVDNRSD